MMQEDTRRELARRNAANHSIQAFALWEAAEALRALGKRLRLNQIIYDLPFDEELNRRLKAAHRKTQDQRRRLMRGESIKPPEATSEMPPGYVDYEKPPSQRKPHYNITVYDNGQEYRVTFYHGRERPLCVHRKLKKGTKNPRGEIALDIDGPTGKRVTRLAIQQRDG